MSEAFKAAQAKARIPGSAVLNAWRAQHGPATTGQLRNQNDIQPNLTVQELANIIVGGAASSAGPAVSESTAMKVSAVYSCVALVAGAISTMPLLIYQRTGAGRELANHPYWWLFNEQPDTDVSAAVFWEFLVASRKFYGDCFAEIVRPSFGSTKAIGFKAHHPLRVNPFRDSAGDLWYRVQPLVGAQYVLHPADVIHVPSLGYDGLRSPSPITYAARSSVGTALAASEYSARFFSNGARPDFALTTKGNMTEDQARLLRATWGEHHGGVSNSHLPAILTGGLEIQQLTLSSVDAQIIETQRWTLEEICRVLGVPPFLVGSTEKTTSWGTGLENMGRGFVRFTLLRDLVKFQQEFNRKLWPNREKYFMQFDVSGIERGDLKSENEALRAGLGGAGMPGWMTPNEVRALKGLPPVPGGDTLFNGATTNVSETAQPAKPETASTPEPGSGEEAED